MSSRSHEVAREVAEREAERERRALAMDAGTDPDENLGPAELAALVRRR